jgi:hypothetical protein
MASPDLESGKWQRSGAELLEATPQAAAAAAAEPWPTLRRRYGPRTCPNDDLSFICATGGPKHRWALSELGTVWQAFGFVRKFQGNERNEPVCKPLPIYLGRSCWSRLMHGKEQIA